MKYTFKIRVKKIRYKIIDKKRNLMVKLIKFLVSKAAKTDLKRKELKNDIIFDLQVEKERNERLNRHKDD